MRELADLTLDAMRQSGAEQAQVRMVRAEKTEINVQENNITLMRTVFDASGQLTAIAQGKKGTLSVNQLTPETLGEAARTAAEMAAVSRSDDANAVAELEDGPHFFDDGPSQGDKAKMLDRMEEFLTALKRDYPGVMTEGTISFQRAAVLYRNTNGVDLESRDGRYDFNFLFSARECETSSSFNYTGAVSRGLDTPLMEQGGLEMLIRQNVEELQARPLNDKFEGEVILSPMCAQDVLAMFIGTFLSTTPLVAGTSVLKDKLGQAVAAECVTVASNPTDPEACGYRVTPDGFRAADMTIVENGVLRCFALNQYGARKTGRDRAANEGDGAFLRPGARPHAEILKDIKRGLLICRFSGGSPSENGDISGVAKNSFYIEDGKIAFPVKETMVSGNLLEMFKNIREISSDTIFDGSVRQPWVRVSGVTVSGAVED
ncbi:MAG: TldD/PmbA family protein [Oscillospiraceae bacterium]|nr:TldD/PmbA family protein [Oscillospiraceae bacterium]